MRFRARIARLQEDETRKRETDEESEMKKKRMDVRSVEGGKLEALLRLGV